MAFSEWLAVTFLKSAAYCPEGAASLLPPPHGTAGSMPWK